MKKTIIVIGSCFLLMLSFFCGCTNQPKNQLTIVSFNVEPTNIILGEYANLSWVVQGASSISINNGIGNVTLSGNQIIQPMKTTSYILTVKNETVTKTAIVQIIVRPNYERMFVGTWENQDGSMSMTFSSNNKVMISGSGLLTLTGTFNYSVTDQKITFSSGDIGTTFNYSFPSENQLIISTDQGFSLVLTKK